MTDTHSAFFHLHDPNSGEARNLAPGVHARIFAGANSMLSLASFEPGSASAVHHHPEEQWGVLLEGDGIRTQGGVEHPVRAGDCWLTPPGVDHSFTAGPRGARVLDVFSPPRAAYLQDA